MPIFVVHKHHVSNPRYDFRLEIDGVLASWAVSKGPSLNPVDNCPAILTEAQPIEYSDFEGLVPQGQNGAKPVMIWDRGHYQLSGDLQAGDQFARGEIQFSLQGVKLRGGFSLVRRRASGKHWTLIKRNDEHADVAWDIGSNVLDRSIVSGHTLEEIAASRTRNASGGVF